MTSKPSVTTACLVLAAAISLSACTDETVLLVVVDTDYEVPGEIDTLEAAVLDEGGQALDDYEFELGTDGYSLPISFGVAPRNGDPELPLVVQITGKGAKNPVLRRRVERLVEGQAIRLPMFLARSCETTTCPDAQVCAEAGCVPRTFPQDRLAEVIPGEETDGLCMPGASSCTSDRMAVEVCRVYGGTIVEEPCPDGTSCKADTGQCGGQVVVTEYRLSVSPTGQGAGVITSVPAGIQCGDNCEETFEEGTSVTLTATPDGASDFLGWSGACSGSGDCTVSMDGHRSVSALFDVRPNLLTVAKKGEGLGRVTSNPGGIDCGTQCEALFPPDTTVTLQAIPDEGHVFVGWSDACSGTGECRVSMSEARSVSAEFNREPLPNHTLEVLKSGDGWATITSRAPGIDCGSDCSQDYPEGTVVVLELRPYPGSVFRGWSGECSGFEQCTISMDGPRTVTANVVLQAGATQLAVILDGPAPGRIISDNTAEIDCGTDCWQDYSTPTQVTLRAAPDPGIKLVEWRGACSSTPPDQSCVLTVSGYQEVRGIFDWARPPRYDLNGDGLEDLVFGAPGAHAPGGMMNAGRVLVFFGDQQNLNTDVSAADRLYAGPGGAAFGASICATEDVSGDGWFDLAIGAPGLDSFTGGVFILQGGPNLPPSGPVGTTGFILGDTPTLRLGASLTAIPDISGDEIPELVVGAPGSMPGDLGKVYVFFSESVASAVSVDDADVIIASEQAGDHFGTKIVSVGDITGDGAPDLAVSAPGWSESGTSLGHGRVYVYSLPDLPDGTSAAANEAVAIISGSRSDMNFGHSLAALDNGEGDPDAPSRIAVGTKTLDSVYIFAGGAALGDGTEGDAQPVLTELGQFGASLAALDFDNDGMLDLAVGAPVDGGPARGKVHILSGANSFASAATFEGNCVDDAVCTVEEFGVSVGPAGDINRDGIMDLAVGSKFGGGQHPEGRGRLTVFFGGPNETGGQSQGAPIRILCGDQTDTKCGQLTRWW